MTKATSKASATQSASRFCTGPGGKLEMMKCCSSGAIAAVFMGTDLSQPSGARATKRPTVRRSDGRRLAITSILPLEVVRDNAQRGPRANTIATIAGS
jgi:hypothetical protein